MVKTTDAAVKAAATLAAEIIRRKDTLTARQVGVIAHTLGIDDPDHWRYLGKLHAQGVEYKPYSSQAGLSTFRGTR